MIEFSATIAQIAVHIHDTRKIGGETEELTKRFFEKHLTEEQAKEVKAYIKMLDDGEALGLEAEDIT